MQSVAGGLGLLLAAVAGVCLGWVLATHLAPPAQEPVLYAATPAEAPRAAAPVLEGISRPPADPKAPRALERGAPRPVVPVADAADVTPVFTLAGKPLPEGRGKDVLRALAMLYAALGNAAEYERFFAQGLEAGLDLADLLGFVEMLPQEQRVACLDRLLAGPLATREAPPVLLANLLAGAGAKERAISLLVARLDVALEADAALALLRLDPKGGAARLGVHAGLGEADNELLGNISAALVEAGLSELAWPFLDRITARGDFPDGVLERLVGANPAMGMRIVERLMGDKREDPRTWNWMGRLREAAGDLGGAFDAFLEASKKGVTKQSLEGMLRADPNRAYEAAKTLDVSGFTGEDRTVLAVLALHHGAVDEAFDTLAKGLSESPGDYTLLNAIVRANPQRAATLLAELSRAHEGDNKDEVLGAYANALRIGGHANEAREAYLEAHALDATDSEWILGLARVDATRAMEALETIRSGNDDEDWWQRGMAECYMRTGRRAEAMVVYNRIEDAYTAASLGLFDPQEGRRRLESLIAKEPRNATNYMALGEMERDLGNLPAARAAFAQAVAIEPANLWNVVRLSEVQERPPTAPEPVRR